MQRTKEKRKDGHSKVTQRLCSSPGKEVIMVLNFIHQEQHVAKW